MKPVDPLTDGEPVFYREGKDRVLQASLFLPHPIETLWPFFGSAENLAKITPPWIRFEIMTPTPISMAVGTLIDYRIGLKGIPMRWRSRISVWEPGVRFVDEQLKGPYKKWHHEHAFESAEGGTRCLDTVHYRVPFDTVSHGLFVKPDLQKIFAYRCQVLREMFAPADREPSESSLLPEAEVTHA